MSLPRLHGRVAWIFAEDSFDVDQIIGVKNIKVTDIEQLAALAMQSYDRDFRKAVHQGDVVVGGRNFGYGHPHYPPMRAMVHVGIGGVIAESFSPGFWRGELSAGLPMAACPGILGIVQRWDEVEVEWDKGLLRNHTNSKILPIEPLAQTERMMIEEGGLIPYLKRAVAADRSQSNGTSRRQSTGTSQ
jgi:3-isopropylmalate/(R)-2-methylmalate dehydratase small subunit